MSLDSSYNNDFKRDNSRENSNSLSRSSLSSHSAHTTTADYSAVSWGAVIAGAVAAAALSLILVILGVGFGMSSTSVWSGQGISAITLGFTTIAWLAFTQIIAYGMGGYLAGRLRTKWVSVHTDEVYFRDTAHGFLSWALASLLGATLLASAIGAIVGGATKAGATLTGTVSNMNISDMGSAMGSIPMDSNSSGMSSGNNPLNYLVGTLFRKDDGSNVAMNTSQDNANTVSTDVDAPSSFLPAESNVGAASSSRNNQTAEVASIFLNNMTAKTLPPDEVKYVGQLVSQQTGITQGEAEKRVTMSFASLQQNKMNAMTQAKDAAETARKATAYASLWFFVMLLVGAFSASLAATWGGKSRDN